MGKIFCSIAVIVAVGVVAVPASILASAFVGILEEQAEDRRKSATTLPLPCRGSSRRSWQEVKLAVRRRAPHLELSSRMLYTVSAAWLGQSETCLGSPHLHLEEHSQPNLKRLAYPHRKPNFPQHIRCHPGVHR